MDIYIYICMVQTRWLPDAVPEKYVELAGAVSGFQPKKHGHNSICIFASTPVTCEVPGKPNDKLLSRSRK